MNEEKREALKLLKISLLCRLLALVIALLNEKSLHLNSQLSRSRRLRSLATL